VTAFNRGAIAASVGVSIALLTGCGSSPPNVPQPMGLAAASSATKRAKSKTFSFTGAQQKFTVPNSVTKITVEASGAAGGVVEGTLPAAGGFVKATIPVTSGQTLAVLVGGTATGANGIDGGFNGGGNGAGGGGGASDIRQGGDTLYDRVIVAGGAGGDTYPEFDCFVMHGPLQGGPGGDLIGGKGLGGTRKHWEELGGPLGGRGGTQESGGAAGGRARGDAEGKPGASGVGGDAATNSGGGGGGGGYYGGGGGGGLSRPLCGGHDLSLNGGGGGGSSYVEDSAADVKMVRGGGSEQNGYIIISW
jgi:hypothetical protein